MNKLVLFGAVAATAVGLAACNNNSGQSANTGANGDREVLYSGVLPAADAYGTVYTLKLDYDDDRNFTDGDFALVENTLQMDSVGTVTQLVTGYSEGDFRKLSKSVDGASVEYLQLTPDAKDGLGATSNSTMYFIVNADGSLTMVGADLKVNEADGLNYTLKVD